ncbi:DNA-binding MarR family transcriptional regulator [Rhodoblastus acidophilus]|uniref:helix-turn-helix domain-containing protein n=1 Tax=Rhodoblastus acidophilus TaxID=1074 RepID=UPI0016129A25|nr:helix-turn-helix domain-containing protein [Rhodoblastus acidophilus]MCW2282606.1 DNA-binding MarR family transcriptional regulator [Rhodoblastus acidophilus]MCW2331467.1 DNA-binding MarR family transcriptional regulator [Rhodoblastus acidophilus]
MMDFHRPRTRAAEIEDDFTDTDNYPAFQYAYNQFLSEHLAELSREFNGDLQQALILCVIGQVFMSERMRSAASGERQPLGITASRLADVCGIPRETVRRKLKRLEQKNWISSNGDQSWTMVIDEGVATARRDLLQLDQRAAARLARMHATLERLVRRPEDAAPRKCSAR